MMISRQTRRERAALCRFLSRCYACEVDAKFLAALGKLTFPEADGILGEGYKMLRAYLVSADESCLDSLAVDYASAFLAAGAADGAAAIPCESVYTSNNGIFMQESWEDVCKIYAQHSLGKSGKHPDLMEDHISAELEFLAFLIENVDAGEQLSFLQQHLLNWVPRFAGDIDKYVREDFYKAIARITIGFLQFEESLLSALNSGEATLSRSYSVRSDRMRNLLAVLKERYCVYAPIEYGSETVYGEISELTDIIHKRAPALTDADKLFTCADKDIIAICCADDAETLRGYCGNAKLIILESGSGILPADFSGTISIDDICSIMEICDEELLPYFADEVPIKHAEKYI